MKNLLSRFCIAAGITCLTAGMSLDGLLAQTDGETEQWTAPARAAKKKNPIPADKKSLKKGRKLYKRECISCHGKEGKGDGQNAKTLKTKARDFSNKKIWEQSDGSLFWKITTGQGEMATFKHALKEKDRWNVINYIRSTFFKERTEAQVKDNKEKK